MHNHRCETMTKKRKVDVTSQARRIGVRTIPAVAVDGELVSCYAGGGPEESALRVAGIGQVA